MITGMDYMRLKHLGLKEYEIEKWEKKAEEIQEKGVNFPVIDSIRGCSPEHVFAETVRHKPDVVIIDYLQLMRSSRPSRNADTWQSLTEVSQDLKQNARTLNIPIIAAAQTNRSGAREGSHLDNIGGSLSITQDTDVMIGMFQDEELAAKNRMQLRMNKNRRGPLGNIDVIWNHEALEFREVGTEDRFKRNESITDTVEKMNSKKRERPGGDK
jgi:replicative DNA helicase